jgi:hypothetical protein
MAAAAGCAHKHRPEAAMSNGLPLRPNAAKANAGVVKRYEAMFADRTAKNLEGQRKLHAEMCEASLDCLTKATIGDVHCSTDFVLWHRAFLYYHEQILCALGTGDVGLPYWNWGVDLACPPAYDPSQFSFGQHMAHLPDDLDYQIFNPDHIVGVVAGLRSLPPGQAAADLFQEQIHMLPHNYFGWDYRTNLAAAAGDPLFYGHHGNLDRLATHIFEGGWPAPSGIHYHFIEPNGNKCCTTLDRFATTPSPYEGDQRLDTSAYRVTPVDDVPARPGSGYSRVRVKLHFSRPLAIGLYQLVSGKGARLTSIASIEPHGGSDFIVWLTVENYRAARAEGVTTATENVPAELTHGALLVTKQG